MSPATDAVSAFLVGVVAAEGCFTRSGRRFRFTVHLAAIDAELCSLFHDFFGVGTVHRYERRKPHYDDEVVFAVQSIPELVEVVVPFMDEHLPASHKRSQYEAWRATLLDYWESSFRRREQCEMEGCQSPARAHNLCRGHYYARYHR